MVRPKIIIELRVCGDSMGEQFERWIVNKPNARMRKESVIWTTFTHTYPIVKRSNLLHRGNKEWSFMLIF